jgi:hypothetical protein
MRQAGYLTEAQMPKIGGDNPHVNVKGALAVWAKRRPNAKRLDGIDVKKPLANGFAHASVLSKSLH